MKTLFLLLFFPTISAAQTTQAACESFFENRETQSQEALTCFLSHQEAGSSLEQARVLNRLSYLKFFIGVHIKPNEKLEMMQASLDSAKASTEKLAPWMNEETYKVLPLAERRELSFGLYYYGTALAAKAEIQGNLAVVLAWPEIQKVMRLIQRLGAPDVEGYGAFRTLAIANTRIPAIAGGDKKLAEQYFKLTLKNTSEYSSNVLGYADLLLRMDRVAEHCTLIKPWTELTEEALNQKKPGSLEVKKDLKSINTLYSQKCI